MGAAAGAGDCAMDLFLMRHGKAGQGSPSPADSARALTAAGEREVRRTAAGLRRAGITFEHVASSPLARAMQTAEIVAPACAAPAAAAPGPAAGGGRGRRKGGKGGRTAGAAAPPSPAPAVHAWDELRPEADLRSALERIAAIGFGTSVLLVGHEPGMTALLGRLVSGRGGVNGPLSINLKKGGMARLRILSTVPEVGAELRWLATPRQLRCL